MLWDLGSDGTLLSSWWALLGGARQPIITKRTLSRLLSSSLSHVLEEWETWTIVCRADGTLIRKTEKELRAVEEVLWKDCGCAAVPCLVACMSLTGRTDRDLGNHYWHGSTMSLTSGGITPVSLALYTVGVWGLLMGGGHIYLKWSFLSCPASPSIILPCPFNQHPSVNTLCQALGAQ